MGQISGNSVVFQMGEETTWGTAVPATEQIRISSESLKAVYNKIDEGLATGGKGSGKVQTMSKSASGSAATLFRSDMGLFLKALCGVEANGVYTAIGTELTDSLPSLSLYVDRKAGKFCYPGAKINQASFSASAGQYLSVGFDFVAKEETEVEAMTEGLTPSAKSAFVFAGGSVKINNAVVADVTAIDWTWLNNLSADVQTTQTGEHFKEPECGVRQISGNFEMIYSSEAEAQRKALYKSDNTFALELKFVSGNDSMTVEIPACQCSDAGANMGSPSDMLRQSMSWNAVEDGVHEYCTITLVQAA